MDSVRVTQFPLSTTPLASTQNHFRVFPNPVTQNSLLLVEMENSSRTEIQLLNINGVELHTQAVALTSGSNTISLASFGLNSRPKGIYIIAAKTDDFVQFLKIQN